MIFIFIIFGILKLNTHKCCQFPLEMYSHFPSPILQFPSSNQFYINLVIYCLVILLLIVTHTSLHHYYLFLLFDTEVKFKSFLLFVLFLFVSGELLEKLVDVKRCNAIAFRKVIFVVYMILRQ